MEIILTHEQADFDALASMLAAHLLSDQSIPVLPNKINRNLRKFINLYGFELPFIEYRDLPPQPVELITLVDTQALVTLKGITKSTKVHVIDHHQEKSDFPVNWVRTIEKVGSTTTILTDLIHDRDIPLSMIQATMLLLGIYEDTGSLTYVSTTVKDAKAVAFLLEKGANLHIASEFLNPSLSDEQRKLADRLLENAKTLTIHDKSVLISSADGQQMREEISSVAHKIRDLLDPDALFLLVRTSEGIRMISRSTNDDVNVGKIAAFFGGGGHERAAAALIPVDNNSDLSDIEQMHLVQQKLVDQLKIDIKPSLIVSKIMSKKPQLISTETTVSEAESLMKRYGYEGYPVIKDEEVVGLLTRRAVDRARSHKLNLTAGSLMEAGNYSLSPDQSIEQVQNLMAATGWGQLPVVEPSTGKIIGIVTRTDLLKNLITREKLEQPAVNYAALIEKALPHSRMALLKGIIETASVHHQALYIVGGFVRDLLLGIPSKDFDIVVEGDALTLAYALVEQFGGRVISHRRFGTAKWQIKEIRYDLLKRFSCSESDLDDLPESLDLISARTEFYDHPTALPTVEKSSIKQDLHRRDFTINTLALRLDGSHYGEIYDYWGGLNDLNKKQVKVLHSLSFVDDPTRLLRAVRFEQRFDFQIETRTLQLMSEARSMLKQVSADRLRHEIDLIFTEDEPGKALDRLAQLDLLTAIHPAMVWSEDQKNMLERMRKMKIDPKWELPKTIGNIPILTTLSYLIWLIPMGQENGVAIAQRLHLSNELIKTIEECAELWEKRLELTNIPASSFVRTFQKIPQIGLFTLFCLAGTSDLANRIEKYNASWKNIEPVTDGLTLQRMGIPPGPRYALIIDELRNARLDEKIKDDEQEEKYLAELLQNTW